MSGVYVTMHIDNKTLEDNPFCIFTIQKNVKQFQRMEIGINAKTTSNASIHIHLLRHFSTLSISNWKSVTINCQINTIKNVKKMVTCVVLTILPKKNNVLWKLTNRFLRSFIKVQV